MNKVILDLETTGLDPRAGHRIVEIGAIKVDKNVKTDEVFHVYLDPERDMPEVAFRIHGISGEFLKGKPKFKDVASDFISFIGDRTLVAHNASFDVGFLNHELGVLGHSKIESHRVIDTLFLARRKFPGASASLDSLCKRFGISLEERKSKGHGALLDSELLYEVYIRLVEGVQSQLSVNIGKKAVISKRQEIESPKKKLEPRKFLYPIDNANHEKLLDSIKDSIWKKEQV